MKPTHKIVKWFLGLNPTAQALFQSIVAAATFYSSAILTKRIEDSAEKGGIQAPLLHAISIIIVLVVFALIDGRLKRIAVDIQEEDARRRRVLAYAASLMDQYASDQMVYLRKKLGPSTPSPAEVIEGLISSKEKLETIVRKLYQLFEAHYSKSERIDDKIDFEVTFMARSYVDGEITIAAYANREGRAPPSLADRRQNKNAYKNTVVASIYQEPRPSMRLIPNTAEPVAAYSELYPGQKERIQSTLVSPVLSDQNSMLGAVVVHCNSSGFFQPNDRRFWNELLEIFGKRLALEKSRLDILNSDVFKETFKVSVQVPF